MFQSVHNDRSYECPSNGVQRFEISTTLPDNAKVSIIVTHSHTHTDTHTHKT